MIVSLAFIHFSIAIILFLSEKNKRTNWKAVFSKYCALLFSQKNFSAENLTVPREESQDNI